MFQNPMVIEVDSAAAFISLAKDLKPKGRVIVFEQVGNGAFKFLTDQEGHLMGVQYNVQARHPVSSPEGEVTHEITSVIPTLDSSLALAVIMQNLDIHGREKSRLDALNAASHKLLSSNKSTTIKWTSRNVHIKNLRIEVVNVRPGIARFIAKYTNTHVKTTTKMLEEYGFQIVSGKIRRA